MLPLQRERRCNCFTTAGRGTQGQGFTSLPVYHREQRWLPLQLFQWHEILSLKASAHPCAYLVPFGEGKTV